MAANSPSIFSAEIVAPSRSIWSRHLGLFGERNLGRGHNYSRTTINGHLFTTARILRPDPYTLLILKPLGQIILHQGGRCGEVQLYSGYGGGAPGSNVTARDFSAKNRGTACLQSRVACVQKQGNRRRLRAG